MAVLDAAVATFDFADQLALISSELLRFRIRNKARLSAQERKDLEKFEMDLDKATAKVRAAGIAELGNLTENARTEIQGATEKAEAFLKRIRKIEKVIGVITAVLGLVLAISTGAPRGVLDAAKAVKNATESGSA
jgi:uncharacterized protein YjbJ (UPF0337 family)